jgi:transportin-1
VIAAEDDEENQGQEDREQDIRPSFRGQKDKGGGGGGGGGGEAGGEGGSSRSGGGGGEDDDDDNEEEGDDDDDNDPAQWNLRKSSANGFVIPIYEP